MESITKASLKGLPLLTKFVSLHCTERKYSFHLRNVEMQHAIYASLLIYQGTCREPVEKLYYVAKYPAICVYCAEPMMGNMDAVQQYLPQCDVCKNKPPVSKK